MSRWIDADALVKRLKQHHDFFVKAWGGFKEMPLSDKARCDELSNSMAEIINAPSIDIVRCKECKYYDDEDYGEPTRYCTWHESVVNADDFCSYGERSEKPNNSKERSE